MQIISVIAREEMKLRHQEYDRQVERRHRQAASTQAVEEAGHSRFSSLEARFSSLRDTAARTASSVGVLFGRPAEPECC